MPIRHGIIAGLFVVVAFGAAASHAHEAPPPAKPADKNERVLSDAQREAVLRQVRGCWHAPQGKPAADASVTLLVIIAASGEVLDATVVPEDQDRVDTPALRPFARSALQAVTDPHCAQLDIPNGNLGRAWLFRLPFTPPAPASTPG